MSSWFYRVAGNIASQMINSGTRGPCTSGITLLSAGLNAYFFLTSRREHTHYNIWVNLGTNVCVDQSHDAVHDQRK